MEVSIIKSSRDDVEKVLRDLQKSIRENKIIFNKREKNLSSLAKLGITIRDAIEEIEELTYDNYVTGPEIDRDDVSSDKYWIFKKTVFYQIIYIKFKIKYKDNNSIFVMSFHISE